MSWRIWLALGLAFLGLICLAAPWMVHACFAAPALNSPVPPRWAIYYQGGVGFAVGLFLYVVVIPVIMGIALRQLILAVSTNS